MPARLEGPTRALFEHVGAALPLARRAVLANLWLTRPVVIRNLEASPTTNAMVRTTLAPTIFQAGTKDNVLASRARAVLNSRILPGDTIAKVVAHVRRVVNDERVHVRTLGRLLSEPSPISPTDSAGYRDLERAIRRVTPDAIVAPYLVVVATDARHYAGLATNVFRFLPVRLTPRDLERMHGTDERLPVADYHRAIRTYRQIVLEAAGP